DTLANRGRGRIAPDGLAGEIDVRGGRRFYRGSGRTSLRAIEPSVRTPSQAVGHGMRILQPKSAQMHHGIAIGYSVAIGIRIRNEIRWIEYPYLSTTLYGAGGYIEP